MPRTSRDVPLLAAGLFAVWMVHDVEEALTMPDTSRRLAEKWRRVSRTRLRAAVSRLPVTSAESVLAIALMGTLVGAASVEGMRTGGRSLLFQSVLAGLHAHVFSHVAISVHLRGYATGVVSASTVLGPYCMWARRRLRFRGVLVEGARPYLLGGVLLLPATIACHAVARALCRRSPSPPAPRR